MEFDFFHTPADATPIRIPAIGLELKVRMPPAASGGGMAIIETTNAPGFGPPLHRHAETEVFHVLQGRYLFEVDGKRFNAETGDTVTVPGGLPHGFVNVADQPSRQLVVIVPGLDATAFFTELGNVMHSGRPDMDLQKAFSRKWGVDFLGPPLRRP